MSFVHGKFSNFITNVSPFYQIHYKSFFTSSLSSLFHSSYFNGFETIELLTKVVTFLCILRNVCNVYSLFAAKKRAKKYRYVELILVNIFNLCRLQTPLYLIDQHIYERINMTISLIGFNED